MGFFQDLKEDLSQAVNELMPDEELMEPKASDEKEEGVKKEAIKEEKVEKEISIDPEELDALLQDEAEEKESAFSPDMVAEIEAALNHEEEELDIDLEAKVETDEEDFEEIEEIEEIEETEEELMESVEEEQHSHTVEENNIEEADKVAEAQEEKPEIKTEEQEEKGDRKMTETTKLTGVATDETAIITAGMTINGDISSKGSIDVLGTINGNVESLGKLDIAGTINGDSKAAEVYADSANITGEVRSEGAIKLGQSSVIIGNIFATSAVIAGAVKGDIDVKGPVILDTTAIVMGNIKSKSVQINNGAVIEGLCSQCYADVNPTAFFEDLKKKK